MGVLMDTNLQTGFIGLGVMGNAMAGHLLTAGYSLGVYTRTEQKAKNLVDAGAQWFSDPASLAKNCDVIFTMVGYPSDVEEIYLGPNGILEHAKPGSLVIDMTTSSPALAQKIYAEAKKRGIDALDAPVSGGDIGAKNATLTIMVGGEETSFQRAKPFLETLGKTIIRQGAAGAGQHTKMANQIAVAGNLVGAVEAITYARSASLDPRTVLLSIANGAASSWQLSNMVPRMLDSNFAPGFYVKHFLKDLRIALESAEQLDIEMPFLSLAKNLFEKLMQEGFSELGTHALYLLYEKGLL